MSYDREQLQDVYERIQKLLRDHKAEFESLKIPYEFLQNEAEAVDFRETVPSINGPLKKYWTRDELEALNLKRLWDLEKSVLNSQNGQNVSRNSRT